MKARFAVTAALALALPVVASALDPFLGARVGYALPFGGILPGRSVRDVVKSDVPIQFDAGYEIARLWTLGAYLSYAFGQLAGEADSACGAADCTANVFRIGVQGTLSSEVGSGREVWAGVFAGWERLDLNAPGPLDLTARGWELGLQGGLDFTGGSAKFGPFVSLGVGRFSSVSEGGAHVSLPEDKTHFTLQLGVRGAVTL